MTEKGEALLIPRESTAPPTACAKSVFWFAIQTRPRHEKAVASELTDRGIQVFLPLVSVIRQWSDRKREVTLPLFTNYAFVRITKEPASRSTVLKSHGVLSFVGIPGSPTPIPDEQISAVETILSRRLNICSVPFLEVGRRIRVRGGSLDGIEGVVASVNGDCSLVISVAGINKSIAVRLSGYQIEAA